MARDAEEALLRHLEAVKQAVADGAGRAPDVAALRNLIRQLFESVELVDTSFNPFASGKVKKAAGSPRERWSTPDSP